MAHPSYKFKVVAILISIIAFLSSKPVGLVLPTNKTGSLNEQEQLQVGSRPPACLNKCSSCRPCRATLVTQPPQQKRSRTSSSRHGLGEGENYYLLAWKCKCRNKIYHP